MAGMFVQQADGKLVEVTSTPFENEDIFQALLANNPRLIEADIPGEDGPIRLMLVAREAGIPGQEGEGARWSLDHLFVDAHAVPTLVEVKRASDTRIRREVVAQMMDYAANSVEYLSIDRVLAAFESTCQEKGTSSDQELEAFLGNTAEPGDFWTRFDTNLKAGRIRLLFVADSIPYELQRIVEFLNVQMSPAEVLAVEVGHFTGEGMTAFVPRVYGNTAEAAQRKSSGRIRPRRRWDEASFFEEIRSDAAAYSAAFERLIDWAKSNGFSLDFGSGSTWGTLAPRLEIGGKKYSTFRLWTEGSIQLLLGEIFADPPFVDPLNQSELFERLQLGGILKEDLGSLKSPNMDSDLLLTNGNLDAFIAAWDWYIEKIRSEVG